MSLGDDTTYHFASQLDREPSRLANTIEVFAFGTYSTYLRHQDACVALDPSQVRKLIRLTVLLVVGQNTGHRVPFSHFLEEQQLGHALSVLGQKNEDLERVLIDMKYEGLIDVKIDEVNETVEVLRAPVARDAYLPEYPLKVMAEEEVLTSVPRAREYLLEWATTIAAARPVV